MSRTLMLLSGGLDSTAAASLIKPSAALFVDYGQVCALAEADAASKVCKFLGLDLLTLGADCSIVGTGDLGSRAQIDIAPTREWWPFRNQLLATLAGAFAVANGFERLAFGTVSSDDSHVDGTPTYFDKLNAVMRIQEGRLEVFAPVIGLSSPELIQKCGLDMRCLSLTHSCHVSNVSCGRCRGCEKRASVLRASGLVDDRYI